MMRRIFPFLLLFVFHLLYAEKLPEITTKDAKEMIEQVSQAHACCKKISPEMMKRAIEQFLDILDPTKTYFLKEEIALWLNMDQEDLAKNASWISQGDFSLFFAIHGKFVETIYRRREIDKTLSSYPRPAGVKAKEFKNQKWVENLEELSNRLLRIDALRQEATQKLPKEAQEKARLRLLKAQKQQEEAALAQEKKNKEQFVLTNTLRAISVSFDSHTAYFTPREAAQFMIQLQQRLYGVGVGLRDDLNGFTIVKIIEGGPAAISPIKVGDRLIAIDNESIVGLGINDVVEIIRGERGKDILLTLVRASLSEEKEETFELRFPRGEVVLKEARFNSEVIPFGEGIIAHLSLHAFYQDQQSSSASDLKEEINKLKKNHSLKGIILDLRQNSGGLLPQAVSVTGLFITKGIVVSIKDNSGHIEHLRELDGKTTWDGPLIVLTSKASASAAEIVTQCLKDYGRAIIVGDEHTYGKGTFQTFTPALLEKINPKGEFKITRGRYYTVSGNSPQLWGVIPHIVVPGIYSAVEIGERYAKFPLENDTIAENYDDDLSDILPRQREQISWLYRFNLQQKMETFTKNLPVLQKNVDARLVRNILYQNFLKELKEEEVSPLFFEFFGKTDFQLEEACNIMKDLIVLCP